MQKIRIFAVPIWIYMQKIYVIANRIRQYVLPIAIILGLLLHDYCAAFSVVVPYIIFTILLLTFSAVDIKKLRFKPMFVWIILFQVVVSLGGYALLKVLHVNEIIAEGVLIGVLCPVAASVAVVSTMLGADRNTVTSFSVIGNLVISIVAPVYFSFIGVNQDMPFLESFLHILRRIGLIIGLPFYCLGLAALSSQSQQVLEPLQRLGLLSLGRSLVSHAGTNYSFYLPQRQGQLEQHSLARHLGLTVLHPPIRIGQMDWAQVW